MPRKATKKRTIAAPRRRPSNLARAQRAIETLSPAEYKKLLDWLHLDSDDEWDQQMKADAAAGRFESFRQEIRRARAAGELQEMPF